MERHRWPLHLVVALVGAWAAACAADAGDDPKSLSSQDGAPPSVEGGVDTRSGDDAAPPLDSPPPPFDSPQPDVVADASDAPLATDAPDVGPDAPHDALPDTPPLEGGTGCATGATVILMPSLGNSGNFGTTGAVCIEFMGTVNGWNASNVQGRSVVVTGSTTQSPPITGSSLPNQPGLGPGTDGFIYWNFTGGASAVTFASVATF